MMDAGLPQLLRTLATARQELKSSEYNHRAVEAQAETRATNNFRANNDLGKNAEDRARQLIVALDSDPDFRLARKGLWDAQANVHRLEAEVEILHAQRREREQDLRERLITLAEQGRLPTAL